MINKINVRVYACCLKDGKILTLNEEYAGQKLIKLPGGGLEFGEGLTDCLHREFAEELNVKITNLRHFYTQEHFVQSRFRENEQLLTVYFLAEILDLENLKILDPSIDKTEWLPLGGKNPFELPVDRLVFEKLKEDAATSSL